MSDDEQAKLAASKILDQEVNGNLGLMDSNALANHRDLKFALDKSDYQLETWEAWAGVMTTKDAIDALRTKIRHRDDPTTIGQNTRMIERISKETKVFAPVSKQLYWDAKEIFTAHAQPLRMKSLKDRVYSF